MNSPSGCALYWPLKICRRKHTSVNVLPEQTIDRGSSSGSNRRAHQFPLGHEGVNDVVGDVGACLLVGGDNAVQRVDQDLLDLACTAAQAMGRISRTVERGYGIQWAMAVGAHR